MTILICENDRYTDDAITFTSVDDFRDMCREVYNSEPVLSMCDHGDRWVDDQGSTVLRRVGWTVERIDPDDDCDISGAVTVHLTGWCDATALVVRDDINGGWTVYGDEPSLWLEHNEDLRSVYYADPDAHCEMLQLIADTATAAKGLRDL